jgi:sugar lactone lactonase YvrE
MTIQTNADGTKKTFLKNLFPTKKLVMPNGLLLDPEGRLYVGTSIGVFRFDPKNDKKEFNIDAELETVEKQLDSLLQRT